jgi:hypothetical protein
MSHERREDHPHDPLTEIGADMLATFEERTQNVFPGARAIVIMSHADRRGIALSGYAGEAGVAQAVEDLIGHTRAILRTQGMNLEVVRVPRGGGGVA